MDAQTGNSRTESQDGNVGKNINEHDTLENKNEIEKAQNCKDNKDSIDARRNNDDQNDGILSSLNPFKRKTQTLQIETTDDVPMSDIVSTSGNIKQNNSYKASDAPPTQQQESSDTKLHDEIYDDLYDLSGAERGYAVLIVNETFRKDPDSKRDGAQEDARKMKEIAHKLGLKVFNEESYLDLDKRDMLKLLQRAQKTDHSNFNCFALMISTHGLETRNARADGRLDHALECSDHQLIFTSAILEMFNDENCPSLKDKPKLLFIQACRGDNVDHGCDLDVSFKGTMSQSSVESIEQSGLQNCERSIDNHETLSSDLNNDSENDPDIDAREQPDKIRLKFLQNFSRPFKNKEASATYSLRCHNDMLVMYAVPESMYAWRSTLQGSWMIHYLHAVVVDYDPRKPKTFLSLLTMVAALMAMRETNVDNIKLDKKKAVPVIEHKLTRDIVF